MSEIIHLCYSYMVSLFHTVLSKKKFLYPLIKYPKGKIVYTINSTLDIEVYYHTDRISNGYDDIYENHN
jgi:hypothetical protein